MDERGGGGGLSGGVSEWLVLVSLRLPTLDRFVALMRVGELLVSIS